VGIRASLEVLEKRKIHVCHVENRTIIHPFSGLWRDQCMNLFFSPLVGQRVSTGVPKKKMAATLKLVLCLLVMYLSVNWVTPFLSTESPFIWIGSLRTLVLWLLDLYQSKIMKCWVLHEILLGLISS
jgi:hypothetical protein